MAGCHVVGEHAPGFLPWGTSLRLLDPGEPRLTRTRCMPRHASPRPQVLNRVAPAGSGLPV